jgi:hypothetical protein
VSVRSAARIISREIDGRLAVTKPAIAMLHPSDVENALRRSGNMHGPKVSVPGITQTLRSS